MSGLKKLIIEAYSKIDYLDKKDSFTVMFNPDTYTQKYEIEYDEESGDGASGTALQFGKIKPQEYSFDFIFDGTGTSAPKEDVSEMIDHFLTVCGKLDGDIHRPLFLKIRWGYLVSECVLKTADITYTLFSPDGYPLRAKVSASFTENIDDEKRTSDDGKNSPDLTHYRTVEKGDTLPLMTYRIYNDASYYMQVARANNLNKFRNLKVGSKLFFPPIIQSKGI